MRILPIALLVTFAVSPAAHAKPAPAAVSEVEATFVSGDSPPALCGVVAWFGTYVYTVEKVVRGKQLKGKIVVDVSCPEFAVSKGVTFAPGQRHRLTLRPLKAGAMGARTPKSPLPRAPRLEATNVVPG